MADLKGQNGGYINITARSYRGLQANGYYRSLPVALMALASQASTWQTGDDFMLTATISDMRSAFMICRLDCTRGKTEEYLSMLSGSDPRNDIFNAIISSD